MLDSWRKHCVVMLSIVCVVMLSIVLRGSNDLILLNSWRKHCVVMLGIVLRRSNDMILDMGIRADVMPDPCGGIRKLDM